MAFPFHWFSSWYMFSSSFFSCLTHTFIFLESFQWPSRFSVAFVPWDECSSTTLFFVRLLLPLFESFWIIKNLFRIFCWENVLRPLDCPSSSLILFFFFPNRLALLFANFQCLRWFCFFFASLVVVVYLHLSSAIMCSSHCCPSSCVAVTFVFFFLCTAVVMIDDHGLGITRHDVRNLIHFVALMQVLHPSSSFSPHSSLLSLPW